MTERQTQTAAYWSSAFTVEEADLEYVYNLLLEDETPLDSDEMALLVIRRRCEQEAEALKQRQQGALIYRPRETYAVGQRLIFPLLQLTAGTVTGVRPGHNPDQGDFDVVAVEMAGGVTREFAVRLPAHLMNDMRLGDEADEIKAPEAIFAEHGPEIAAKLQTCLQANPEIVRIAGRWFPRALLASINIGHLNLAEAVLDMAGGGPLPTEALLAEVGLPAEINPRLQAFSLNYALQEDARFDEVGPAGQILWYLRRLEPPEVVFTPRRLENTAPACDRSRLTPTLLALEHEIEDELAPAGAEAPAEGEVLVTLTFPHRRVGTLPLSPRLAGLFPTAHQTSRVRFTFVDGDSGQKFPGWVVRTGKYVFGLDEWYQHNDLPVGGQLNVSRGQLPDEIVVKACKRRPAREWVRTATVGADSRLAFSMLKRPIAVAYDDLMIVAVDNATAVDEIWLKYQRLSFERLVADVFRELAKLNPQSTVHAKSLYAAVNVARRSPPGPIFAELLAHPCYVHVGDAYWRFDASYWTE